MKRFLLAAAFFAVLVLLWEAAYRAKIWSPVLLPSPSQVVTYLEGAAADGTLARATVITMRRLLIGYFIGLVVGLPLGLLTARWKLFGDTIGTLALGLQTLPSVCWVPLALLWFGQTEAAMLFVVVMGTLWSVIIATETGVRNVPPIYRRAALTMGSKRLHMWFKVILPAALPFIVSGMKQGWAFAWRSLMAAEIFVTIVGGFRSEIWVVKGGRRYSASSLIDILRANLDCGATAMLEAHGVDADDALDELEKLLAELHEKETD